MASEIALSFDNGPTPGVTDLVLDTLAEHDVQATFFVIGERLANPAGRRLAERAVAEGHRVGGHTWSHTEPLGLLSDASVDEEIDRTAAEVEGVGGDPLLFRPFGRAGAIGEHLVGEHGARRLCDGGFTCVLWNAVPGDWRDPEGWPQVALDMVKREDEPVLVLHDRTPGAMPHLDAFVGEVIERGHSFSLEAPDSATPIRYGAPTDSYRLLGLRAAF